MQNLFADLGNENADIGKLVNDVTKNFSNVVKNVTPIVENLASALPEALGQAIPAISGLLPPILEAVAGIFDEVLSSIIGLLPELAPVAVDAVLMIAQTLVENVLQRESVIDVVCGHNDAEVVGAYNAAVAQGRDEIKFIGIAGDIDVLTWIQSGNEAWLGEVLQDPVVLGYQATDAMYHALVLGETLPDKYDLPEPEAITPANIADYAWQSWGWLG